MRGDGSTLSNSHILILLDGRPFREGLIGNHNSLALFAMPLERVERIEIVRGPGSVLYGTGAYSGVINILTKKGDAQKTAISGRIGSVGTKLISGATGFSSGDLHIGIGGTLGGYDNWDYSVRGEDSLLNTLPFSQNNFSGNIRLDYKGFTLNAFGGLYSQDIFNFGAGGFSWDDIPEKRNNVIRTMVDVGYSTDITEDWTLSANVTYNFHDFRRFNPLDSIKEDVATGNSDDILGEITSYIKPAENINIVVGALFYNQNGISRQHNIIADSLVRLPNGLQIPAPFDIASGVNPRPAVIVPQYGYTWLSGYFQADWTPMEWIKLVVGAQVNKVNGIDADLVPRLGAVMNFGSGLSGKLLYGQAFRAPFAVERTVSVFNLSYGNDALKPEKVTTIEAQVGYTSSGYEITATYFRSNQNDAISQTSFGEIVENITVGGQPVPPAAPKYINRGELLIQGVEIEGRAFFSKDFSLSASMSYQTQEQTFRRPGTTADTTVENRQGMPQLLVKVGADYALPQYGLAFSLFNIFVGSYVDINAPLQYNPEVADYNSLNANITFDIAKIVGTPDNMVRLRFTANNLLDEQIMAQEVVRRRLNSLPNRFGRTFFGSLLLSF
jgi:outer membrane receptor protein involved in Fe transport